MGKPKAAKTKKAATKSAYPSGTCCGCGCTQQAACINPKHPKPCAWVDQKHTLCTTCLAIWNLVNTRILSISHVNQAAVIRILGMAVKP